MGDGFGVRGKVWEVTSVHVPHCECLDRLVRYCLRAFRFHVCYF